tara:strand:- start:2102 stop:2695 length:594 start_codon:yes stop_codon:yes gene_type:complete
MGNLGSISNAVYSLGWDYKLISEKKDFEEISHLILPGVGAYSSAMLKLNSKNLTSSIVEFSKKGNPVLGICLGMQLLSYSGEEGGISEGLQLINGNVKLLKNENNLHMPHVGWNNLIIKNSHPLLDGIKSNIDFYFVNSYFFDVKKEKNIIAETEYGQIFPSIVSKQNVIGVQFHPEKSQSNGLKILDNFCLWDGKC